MTQRLGSKLHTLGGFWGVPPSVGTADIGKIDLVLVGWYLGIPPIAGGYVGSCVGRDGDLHIQSP